MNTLPFEKRTELELLTAAYFQAHGYLVRRDVTLTTAAGTAEATDIDLLALRFHEPLSEERLVADCKDRRKPHPFERILWTLGLGSFARANRSVVALPQAPWQAREFASQAGIEILESRHMEDFLRSVSATTRPFGEADPALAHHLKAIKKQSQSHGQDVLREDLKLRQMLVIGHPLTNLNRVVRSLSSIGKMVGRSQGDSLWLNRYVLFDGAVAASVMIVRFAAESKWTPEADWSNLARKKLTYGDVPPQKARQLAQLALDRDFFDGLPTPQYTGEIIELIKFLISAPEIASLTPYALDFQLFGRVLGTLPLDYIVPRLQDLQEDMFKIVRRILSALSYAAELAPSIWEVEDAPNPTPQASSQRQDQPAHQNEELNSNS